jgi:hypothetical protein
MKSKPFLNAVTIALRASKDILLRMHNTDRYVLWRYVTMIMLSADFLAKEWWH